MGESRGAKDAQQRSAAGDCVASTARTETIAASPEVIMATLSDFAAYPEWLSAIRSAEVLSKNSAGQAETVSFVLVAGVVDDEYVLRYDWDDDGSGMTWTLAEPTPLQRFQRGSYRLQETPERDGTDVTYELEVELAVPMIGRFRERAERRIVAAALADLARRVEAR